MSCKSKETKLSAITEENPKGLYGMRGRTAIVTGAGQGIGLAVASALAAEGARVALCGRTLEKLEKAAEAIRERGGECLPLSVRVENRQEVAEMVERVEKDLGPLDYLVNNAGIARSAFVVDMAESDWDEVITTNLKGGFLVAQAAARRMVRRKTGSIVNMCSIASFGGQEGRAAYAASKAGLMALTWVMAQELAAFNIRVNGVAPALIGTEMIKKGVPGEFLEEVILDRKPLGRMGEPEEVAQAVLFLLSERSSYITGQLLKVDGGLLSGYFCSNRRAGQSFKQRPPG